MANATAGCVVLCGAGVSVLAPSSVPSWWGFNQTILDELRRRFIEAHPVPKHATKSLDRLNLDAVDVAEFSQIVSDAFAGETWFDVLGVLDGVEPNANHYTLANWAKTGTLRAVVTTNFDTLIERAMESVGVTHAVYDALLDGPPQRVPTEPAVAVVKLHGSAGRRASLIDLAAQKRRGLPLVWLDWLERTFSELHVVVAGFSGADLALGDDYLRLKAASTRTPNLRWLVRPRQVPLEGARAVVELNGIRGQFILGDLPTAWEALGAPALHLSVPSSDGRALISEVAQDNVSAAVDAWLSHPMVDADTCGMALTRLLDAAGKHTAASSLRTSIRTRVRRKLRDGVDIVAATRAALQIGQLARDEPSSRAPQAIRGLYLANRALDAVVEQFPPESREREAVQLELAHNRATLLANIAYFEVLSGRLGEANVAVAQAAEYSDVLSGPRRINHDAAKLELLGAIAYLSGDIEQARLLWQQSHELSKRAGHRARMASTLSNLQRLDRTEADGVGSH